MQNYYEVLGVSPGASQEEIQKACDGLLKECYANLRDSRTHDAYVEKIKRIKQAKDNLADPALRKRYDAASAAEEVQKNEPPNPLRRFVARFFDQLVFFVLFYPAYRYFADYVFFEDWALALEAAGVGILLYFLLETAVLAAFGSTPGKWMLSIHLTDAEGQKPKRPQLAKRNLLSAVMGLALDIPPFSLAAMALSFRDLYREKSGGLSAWDRACGTAVRYDPIRKVRLLLVLPVLAFFIVALVNIL